MPEPDSSHSPNAALRAAAHANAADPCNAPGPQRRDWLLAFGGALVLSDAFDEALYALFGWRATLAPGVPISRVLLLGAFVAAGLLLARNPRAAADHVRTTWLLWPAVALAFLSALWSEQPGTTLLWASALLGTSAFGIALAVRFSPAAQTALIAGVATSIAVSSVLVTLVWPHYLITPLGQWRGIYIQKNLLGRVEALGAAAALVIALCQQRRVRAIGALLLCGAMLAATQSLASILAGLFAGVAALLLLAARKWRQHARAIVTSGTAVSILAVAFLVTTRPGLSLVARSETLSERTTIWRVTIASALETPWLGHGYGAFWPSAVGQKSEAQIDLRIPIDHAHNGALDLFAELGVAGLVLVFVPLAVFAAAALRHALQPDIRACIWPATYLVFFVASNAAESALLRHKLYWALYVAAACHVANHSRRPTKR